jgi:phosphatidylglycerol---prolipoprotein diacylglyceryl transferase
MVGAVLGARIFNAVLNLDVTLADPWSRFSPSAGISSWGGLLGGSGGLAAYCHRNRQVLLPCADAMSSCLGLSICLARCACFLNGDDFGTLSNLPWAVRFPPGSLPFIAQVRSGLLNPMADLSLPVHPVQLYLSLIGLFAFVIATWLWTRLRMRPGATFCSFWLMYCPLCFFMELFRGDEVYLTKNALTVPQVMAVLVFLAAGIGLRKLLRTASAHLRSELEYRCCSPSQITRF